MKISDIISDLHMHAWVLNLCRIEVVCCCFCLMATFSWGLGIQLTRFSKFLKLRRSTKPIGPKDCWKEETFWTMEESVNHAGRYRDAACLRYHPCWGGLFVTQLSLSYHAVIHNPSLILLYVITVNSSAYYALLHCWNCVALRWCRICWCLSRVIPQIVIRVITETTSSPNCVAYHHPVSPFLAV